MGIAKAEDIQEQMKLEYLNAALQRAKKMPKLETLLKKKVSRKAPSLAEIVKTLEPDNPPKNGAK